MKKWFHGAVISSLFFWGSVGYANGFRNPPEGAAALGLGGGKLALVNDTTALAHNPANILDIEEQTFSIHLALGYSGVEYDAPSGASDETEDDLKLLPNIFAVFPTDNENLSWGVAITTPYGQFTEWPKNSPFRGIAPYFAQLTTVDVAPTVAYRLTDAVSIAAGIDVVYSSLLLKSIVPWSAALMAPGLPDGRAKIEGDGVGVGGNAAVHVQVAEDHALALTYTTPVKVEYEGDFTVGNIPPPLTGAVSRKSDFDSEIEFPAIVGLGYGVDVTPTVRVGVDVEWIEFSRFDNLPLDLGRNNAAMLFPPEVPQDWEDTWTAGFGVEWDAAENWVWRAGYIWLESPIPEDTIAPTLPDSDRHIVSIGLGFDDGSQSIDIAYAYSFYEDLDVDRNANPAYIGEYDLYAHLFSVSYGKSF